MITPLRKTPRKVHLVVSESPSGFEIQTGELTDPNSFVKNQTILITGENPSLLWDLLHNLVGIPFPLLESPRITPASKTKPEKEMSPRAGYLRWCLERELNALSSREILKKIETEKGISLTLNPKSKKSIIRKALQIYS